MTKDPCMLRLGASMLMVAAPFFVYAFFVTRDNKPLWSVVCLAVALGTVAFCVWTFRRASRLKP